jgi:hypothetical protein
MELTQVTTNHLQYGDEAGSSSCEDVDGDFLENEFGRYTFEPWAFLLRITERLIVS